MADGKRRLPTDIDDEDVRRIGPGARNRALSLGGSGLATVRLGGARQFSGDWSVEFNNDYADGTRSSL